MKTRIVDPCSKTQQCRLTAIASVTAASSILNTHRRRLYCCYDRTAAAAAAPRRQQVQRCCIPHACMEATTWLAAASMQRPTVSLQTAPAAATDSLSRSTAAVVMGLLQLRYEHDSSTIRVRYNILRGVMCFRAIMNMSILSCCCRML